jgi:hypothetical protein
MKFLLTFIVLYQFTFGVKAQKPDSVGSQSSPSSSVKINQILISSYIRIITDAKGKTRVDENIVANIPLNKWFATELGIRKGERPERFDSYYHYKIDLQTKAFWKRVKLVARMSHNVNQYPTPTYRKSNYLLFAESRWPVTRSLLLTASGGHAISFQENDTQADLPTTRGAKVNYFIFRLGLKYVIKNKLAIEGAYGTFDVFNPYLPQNAFVQLNSELELTPRFSVFAYYRYQYNNSFSVLNNNYTGFGARMRLP